LSIKWFKLARTFKKEGILDLDKDEVMVASGYESQRKVYAKPLV